MFNIQKAGLNELEPLAELFDQYRVFYQKSSDREGAKKFLGERISNNDSKIFVCMDEAGELRGFVQLYPLFSSTRMKKLWLLNDLFVAERFRGRGYSVALIDRAKELCISTGACGLMLETAKDNIIGNELYPKTGFVLEEHSNFYNWSPETWG